MGKGGINKVTLNIKTAKYFSTKVGSNCSKNSHKRILSYAVTSPIITHPPIAEKFYLNVTFYLNILDQSV